MGATDVQHREGARGPRKEVAARQCSQREDGIDSTRGENFRVFLNRSFFCGDDERLLFERWRTPWRDLSVKQAVTPGQFVRRQREFTLDLKQHDAAKFFIRRGRKAQA